MICPKCKAEYRQGFTRCSDCGVDLVYAIPVEAPRIVEAAQKPIVVSEGTEFKALQRWVDAVWCADACLKLRNERVAYRVTEIPKPVGFQMQPRQEFEIAVPVGEFERAKEILEIQVELGQEEDFPSEEEIQSVMELPDHGDLSGNEKIKPEWDPKNWDAEDASVEVWSGSQFHVGDIIELALRENQIHARFEETERRKAILVMPEDEGRAREIVREIVEGAPAE
jgi:hypothetical protein